MEHVKNHQFEFLKLCEHFLIKSKYLYNRLQLQCSLLSAPFMHVFCVCVSALILNFRFTTFDVTSLITSFYSVQRNLRSRLITTFRKCFARNLYFEPLLRMPEGVVTVRGYIMFNDQECERLLKVDLTIRLRFLPFHV